MRISSLSRALAVSASAAALGACEHAPTASAPAAGGVHASPNVLGIQSSAVALVGGKIFFDANLSLNRNQSCATCHDAAWGYSSPNSAINAAGAVMFGSVATRFGNRKPPSAAYASTSPVLFYDDEGGSYVGGNFWDGRATGQRLGSPSAEQALGPFVNPVEQALPDIACVVYRIQKGKYAAQYASAIGSAITGIVFPANTDALCTHEGVTVPLAPSERAKVVAEYDRIGLAVAEFEGSPDVNAFSSKYDAYLAGQAQLTGVERKGLALYEGKAGCAGCHPNAGTGAFFTDYTYDNIGVPPNPKNPELIAHGFVDRGLGAFLGNPDFDGAEKVPTLRNIDKRAFVNGSKAYMHNGVFKSLDEVVHFYNTRDVLPDCAAVAHPSFGKNCWPAPEVAENVNRDELGNLGLSQDEEVALVAYLRTLSDGYWKGRH